MANKETFVVRTATAGTAHRKITWTTTIAEGRPEAVRHVERIGPIDGEDRVLIREFLEGKGNEGGSAIFVSSSNESQLHGTGLIFKVTE